MPEVLALPLLYDAVVDRFTADGTDCALAFGWRTPSYLKVPGSRIVFVPGDDLGNMGELLPPRNQPHAITPGPALAALDEIFHVVISGEDLTAPEDERAQYTATRLLFDAFARACIRYAGNNIVWLGARWLIDRETRRAGAALLVTAAIDAAILDLPFPCLPTSGELERYPDGEITVTLLDETETPPPS